MPEVRPDEGEVAAYAAGRWPVVVRTLVLLGAPPRHAGVLAAEAVSRLLNRWSDDQWLDLDAVLAAETLEAWERDRTPWWRRPELRVEADLAGTDVPAALDVLDALSPPERARLVIGAASGLTADQLDDVLGPAEPSRLTGVWRDELAVLAETIPVGEPRLTDARTLSDGRRRDHRALTITGAVVALVAGAAAIVLGVSAIDPQPAPSAGDASTSPTIAADPGATSRPAVRRGPDLLPVTWYDGIRIHLADRTVKVPRVVAMARVGDGVVVTDDRGLVLHVRSGGTVAQLGTTTPGAVAVAEPVGSAAAWVERGTDVLVVDRLKGPGGSLEVPAGSRVVAVDRAYVYLDGPDGPVRVRTDTLATERARADVLDVASGVVVRTLVGMSVQVERGREVIAVQGRDGWLSDDGTHLLTRDVASGAAPPSVVIDLTTQRPVELPLPTGSVVRDAAFDDDGNVTFVLARANGTEYPADWPRDGDYAPGYDLVICDLAAVTCQQDAQLFASDQPFLAR